MINFSRKSIRRTSRKEIRGNLASLFAADLLVSLLIGLTAIAYRYPILGIIVFLLFSVLEFGLASFYLNYVSSYEVDYSRLIITYKGGLKRFFKHLLTFIIKYIVILFAATLLLIPGLIKRYSYSQVKYIRAEHPDIGVIKCLRISKRMMRFRKYELFVLDLTLIIWYLLIPLTGGLILIYFMPYYSTVMARYHLHIKSIYDLNKEINRGFVSYAVGYLYQMA